MSQKRSKRHKRRASRSSIILEPDASRVATMLERLEALCRSASLAVDVSYFRKKMPIINRKKYRALGDPKLLASIWRCVHRYQLSEVSAIEGIIDRPLFANGAFHLTKTGRSIYRAFLEPIAQLTGAQEACLRELVGTATWTTPIFVADGVEDEQRCFYAKLILRGFLVSEDSPTGSDPIQRAPLAYPSVQRFRPSPRISLLLLCNGDEFALRELLGGADDGDAEADGSIHS